MSDAPEADRPVVAIACLGHLGQWGNQLFQYAFARIIADSNRFRILAPHWLGRRAFGGKCAMDAPLAPWMELPLIADRVVLSHPGWRRWAESREPLRSLTRKAGGQPAGLRREVYVG